MINKLILTLVVLFIGLQSQNAQSNYEEYDLRPIDEINLSDYSDAYPWISDDGLRLYFCGNESGQDLSTIYFASRKSSDESFGEPQALPINITGTDNYSPYLSKDELTMTFASRVPDGLKTTSIFIVSRSQRNEAFAQAIKLELTGKIRGDLISPSFTPDLGELYLFNEYRNHQAIIKLVRIDNFTYRLVNRYVLGKGYRIKSGKLSSNGLKLYLSLEKPNSLPSIHIMSRKTLNTDFQEMKNLDHEILNHPDFRNHQPYFSSDNSYMVFARSDHNEWSRNNLYIARRTKDIVDHQDFGIDITVFPNPSAGVIRVDSQNDLSYYWIEVLTIHGRKVYQTQLTGQHSSIDLQKLKSGNYVIRILDRNNKLVSTKRIQLIDP